MGAIMKNQMTIEEIEAAFDGEWVFVGDPETDEQKRVLRGQVLAHSADRDAVYEAMVALEPKPKKSAMLCFVKTPENMAFVI